MPTRTSRCMRDGQFSELASVERASQRLHSAVHHVRRCDHVDAAARVRERNAYEKLHRRIVVDVAGGVENSRSAVIGVLAVARSAMTSISGTALLMARIARCTTPSGSALLDPIASLRAGMPKSSTAGMPSACSARVSADYIVDVKREMPGIDAIGPASPARSTTKSGCTRWSTVSACSRTSARNDGVRRRRRMRIGVMRAHPPSDSAT